MPRRVMRGRLPLIVGVALLSGCELAGGPSGPFAFLVGTWTYTGTQATPAMTLTGTLTVSDQSDDLILGSLSYEEDDGVGGPVVDGGAVQGRVIGLLDADFDVLLPSGDRRHLARISANGDTLVGEWQQISTGEEGTFRATRLE
jgi:hypothetical protein